MERGSSERKKKLLDSCRRNDDVDTASWNAEESLKGRVWSEMKMMWRIAFPSILYRVTSFGIIVVGQSYLGHVGEIELAAYALLQTIFVRFVNGLLAGMSSATETLCGQAYGARQYHMMGIYLQRSWIVDCFFATLLIPFFIFATPILRTLGMDKDIAIAASKIALWFIPFIYSLVFSMTIQMYLQAQMKNMIVGYLSTFSFALQLFLSWLFVVKLEWGISGAMSAMNIASWSMVIGEFVYIVGGWCPETWTGFSKAAFSDILPIMKLSISSGVMICLEVWYFGILVLLAGYMKNATTAIAAFSICQNIYTWEVNIAFGFLGAACVRVANELGAKNPTRATFSMKVNLCTSICFGLLFSGMCLIFGDNISYMFTDNKDVVTSISSLIVLLSFSILLNSVQPVLSGVAIGAGLQSLVAFVNLASYYAVGIPIGLVLAYFTPLQVRGLWIGMLSGVATQTIILYYIIHITDWDYQVRKTLERLNRWVIKSDDQETSYTSLK